MRVTLVLGANEVKEAEGISKKTVVLGLLKRNGKVYAQIIPDASKEEILPIIKQTV